MGTDANLIRDNDVFSANKMEDIVIIKFKETFLLRLTDLEAKDAFLNYLDLVSNLIEVSIKSCDILMGGR